MPPRAFRTQKNIETMDVFLAILAVLCGVGGILGAVVPVIPGPALSYFGLLCAYWTDSTAITGRMLIIWAVVTVIVTVLDYILPGYFSKVFGGTRAGVIGATVGVFVGLFFGLAGIILGPFFGAVIGELLHEKQELGKALKVGIGSLISFIVGSGIKIIASGFMLFYIWRDVWNMIA